MIRTLTVVASAFRGDGACERRWVAGVDALVARPAAGSGPVVVFANAATSRGIDEPAVARLLGGLARGGFVAVAPELPRLREGELTPETVEALVAVAGSFGPRVALFGASTGAGVALLAAADRSLSERVTGVLAIAPFASLESLLRLATTGCYGDRPYRVKALVASAAQRSLIASAPGDPDVTALLMNRDPDRFPDLFAALDPRTRAIVRELSPLCRIGEVSAPVEVVSEPDDPYFPVEESRALAAAGRDVRLTVTHALDHVRLRRRPSLVRVLAALDRTLTRAAAAEPAPALRPAPVS